MKDISHFYTDSSQVLEIAHHGIYFLVHQCVRCIKLKKNDGLPCEKSSSSVIQVFEQKFLSILMYTCFKRCDSSLIMLIRICDTDMHSFFFQVTVLTVYVFLYGRLYLVMSGLEKSILLDPRIQENIKPLENALASQSVFQLGLLLVLPMIMEVGLEKGFRTALGEFVIMQLQLASVFFTFQLGTKTHYYGRTILHGGAKYRPTGRGFVVYHAKFAENYRLYSRSHFIKGLELLILLVVYLAYGSSYRSSKLYLFVTFSIWFLVASWLFAPFIFNPSCFEWQKTVDDWTDWRKWMGNRGGIGMSVDQSWEAWWISEQEHLRKTSIRALLLEIILSFRFLIYQYGIVYHLSISQHSKSIMVTSVHKIDVVSLICYR
jgi:callose synthase